MTRNWPIYQVLYQVTHPDGSLIMEAPLEVIDKHFKLHPDAVRQIDRGCISLSDRVELKVWDPEDGMQVLTIRRMPIAQPKAEATPEAPEDDPKTFLRENLP